MDFMGWKFFNRKDLSVLKLLWIWVNRRKSDFEESDWVVIDFDVDNFKCVFLLRLFINGRKNLSVNSLCFYCKF